MAGRLPRVASMSSTTSLVRCTSGFALGVLALVSALPKTALAATCGNGNVESGEDCDDGNVSSGDGCDATCQEEFGWECTDATFELDFNETITDDGHATPSWTLSSDKLTVTQAYNADAAVYVSSLPATGTEISVDLTVNTSSDDDFIGFKCHCLYSSESGVRCARQGKKSWVSVL